MDEINKKFEVEKRYEHNENFFKFLKNDAKFIGDELIHDVYYDFTKEYSLLKKEVKFRKRTVDNETTFELKVRSLELNTVEEIDGIEKIKKYFKTENLDNFIETNLISFIEYNTKRNKYEINGLNIHIDNCNFGEKGGEYKVVEIEKMINDESEKEIIKTKIKNFAKEHKLEKAEPKMKVYLERVEPEIFKIYEKVLVEREKRKENTKVVELNLLRMK